MSIAHTHVPILVKLIYGDLVQFCFDVIAFFEVLAWLAGYGYSERDHCIII